MKQYILEIKPADLWIKSEPARYSEDLLAAEKILHAAGIKARVVRLITDREIIVDNEG